MSTSYQVAVFLFALLMIAAGPADYAQTGPHKR